MEIKWHRACETPIPTEPGVQFVAFWGGNTEVVTTTSDGRFVNTSFQAINVRRIDWWLPIPERNL